MKAIKTHTYSYIYKVKDHNKHKKEILKLVSKIPLRPLNEGNDKITNTDWHISKDTRREYFHYIFENIMEDYAKDFKDTLKVYNCRIKNYWFQQYKKDDVHAWHCHDTHYSVIYYIELPDKSMKTEFKDIVTGKVQTFDVQEGDIFTFPGHMIHRSKAFKSNKRKTVAVFNVTHEF